MDGTCHDHKWKRNGRDRNGTQVYRCIRCGITRYSQSERARPRYERTLKAVGVAEYFLRQGYSIRYAAVKAGVSKGTIELHCAATIADASLQCGCGQQRGHRSWCRWRYQQSERRRTIIKRETGQITRQQAAEQMPGARSLYGRIARCGVCDQLVTTPTTRTCRACVTEIAAQKREKAAARRVARKRSTIKPTQEERLCLTKGRQLLRQIKKLLNP